MPRHTTDECHTIRCIVQDLTGSGKLEDLEKIFSVKTSPSPNRALASQTLPTYWAPTFNHYKGEK